jgi:hypothetical protein
VVKEAADNDSIRTFSIYYQIRAYRTSAGTVSHTSRRIDAFYPPLCRQRWLPGYRRVPDVGFSPVGFAFGDRAKSWGVAGRFW